MIARKQTIAGATLAILIAASSPALAGASIFGKKKVDQDTLRRPQAHPRSKCAHR